MGRRFAGGRGRLFLAAHALGPLRDVGDLHDRAHEGANYDLDLVFVIDDSAAMAGWQTQLASQLPLLATTALCPNCSPPNGLHIGVVSSDLGAAANVGIPGCSAAGAAGQFRSQPEAACTDTTLEPGATFISENGDSRNFSAADDASGSGIGEVFQCVAQLGDGGCGFGQPLAALVRALGADGQPPPASNLGFLRPDAYLGIVIISNRDDCSVPAGSTLFASDDPAEGPPTHYRCNHAGHLCHDVNGTEVVPPIAPPSGAASVDGVPTLSLTDCESNDSGGELTPISKLVADIKALKPDPDNQILVSAIAGPASPYAVQWAANAASAGAAWPAVAPSCGTENADGSGAFGEPAVRIAQFASSFPDSVLASVCDPSYTTALETLSRRLEALQVSPCVPADIQSKTDAAGNSYPDCVVSEHLTTSDGTQEIALPACAVAPAGFACWSLHSGSADCAGQALTVTNEPVGSDPSYYTASLQISCQLTQPARSADAGPCPG